MVLTICGVQSYDRWYLFFGILSFLPLFAYHEYNLKGTELEESLLDNNVRLIFAASAAFGVPLLVDIVMDFFAPFSTKNILARLILTSSICVPSLLYLYATRDSKAIGNLGNLYAIVSSSQRIFGYDL